MFKSELRILFAAVGFYTRIPCPNWVGHSHDLLNKSSRYFPLIGWFVAILTFAALWLALLVLPVEIAVIIGMAAGVLVTGAFHEDGFADVCDGFGGGYDKARILDIMKDSRVGSYGVVGLILISLLKFAALKALLAISFIDINPTLALLLIFISAHSVSRFAAVSIVFTSQYVREDSLSKIKPLAKQHSWREVFGSSMFGILPIVVLSFYHWQILLTLIPVALARFLMLQYYTKQIGGYTGDCLGAVQQVCEIVIYLSIIVLWRFI